MKRWLGPAVPRLAIVLVTLLVYAGSFDGSSYPPLTVLSLALDYRLFG